VPKGAHAIPHQTAISHQTAEQLERYALGRLAEPEQAVIEEHLLICEACRQRLDEVEAYAKAMRRAISYSSPIE
jgi:anti-sigma factor ChrR (cupin superfamily)